MSEEITVDMPLQLTREMITAIKESPLTGFHNTEKWHEHLGWLICAYDIIIEQRTKQHP